MNVKFNGEFHNLAGLIWINIESSLLLTNRWPFGVSSMAGIFDREDRVVRGIVV